MNLYRTNVLLQKVNDLNKSKQRPHCNAIILKIKGKEINARIERRYNLLLSPFMI